MNKNGIKSVVYIEVLLEMAILPTSFMVLTVVQVLYLNKMGVLLHNSYLIKHGFLIILFIIVLFYIYTAYNMRQRESEGV